jgi:transposase, IS5 family
MRQERTVQASLFDLFAGHEIGRELKAMSQWLDEDREFIGLVAEDLRRMASRRPGDKVCRQSRSCAVGFSSSIAS